MKIAVITDEPLKEEWLAQSLVEGTQVEWLEYPAAVQDAEAYIDLLFTPQAERINDLRNITDEIIIINAVSTTLEGLPPGFVRINGWKSFLTRNIAEAACNTEEQKVQAEKILACFGRRTEWVPDQPGFISARVVSMIINEAYFALEDGVSSKEEIDTAMQLGTNYPYGPFAWSRIIGLNHIYELLLKMTENNPRYKPSALLEKEALAS